MGAVSPLPVSGAPLSLGPAQSQSGKDGAPGGAMLTEATPGSAFLSVSHGHVLPASILVITSVPKGEGGVLRSRLPRSQ